MLELLVHIFLIKKSDEWSHMYVETQVGATWLKPKCTSFTVSISKLWSETLHLNP